LIEDEEILDFGQTRVQVLHTPGHTAEHLSFHFLDVIYHREEKLLAFMASGPKTLIINNCD
jgi:hypothetical protein